MRKVTTFIRELQPLLVGIFARRAAAGTAAFKMN